MQSSLKLAMLICPVILILILITINVLQYDDKEEVILWMNTVGPYHNRQETYAYFSLPFCQGKRTYMLLPGITVKAVSFSTMYLD